MRCPTCGAELSDSALVCSRCHSSVDVTRKISLSGATWCPTCGALVPPGADTCPKCLSSVREERRPRSHRDLKLPEIGDTSSMDALVPDEGNTGVMTRIESAIPPVSGEESPSASRDRIPRTRFFALTGLLALLVVGGAALLITHPWDPTAGEMRAKEPADTSMSGFPGALDSLSGQDSEQNVSDQTLDLAEILTADHESLGELAEKIGESEGDLRSVGVSGSSQERADGLERAEELAVELSNLVTSIQGMCGGGSEYDESASELATMASWLRNRCDALVESWQRSASSQDPAAEEEDILAPVEGASDYARLFDEGYEGWSLSNEG